MSDDWKNELWHQLENKAVANAQPEGYQRNMVRGHASSFCGRFGVECVPNSWGALNLTYYVDGERVDLHTFRKKAV